MKTYTIRSHHASSIIAPSHARDYTGTLEELIGIFKYTLECGNSWNNKIPLYPKSGKSLVNALNKSAQECRRYCDSYELV